MTDPAYPVEHRNRAKRMYQRAQYDHNSVHKILDAAALCHIAYMIDGQPYCTPTLFWREGTTLYWHGSAASRMVKAQKVALPVCVTVTHFDGIVLARSGMHHSANYRTVMAFGTARQVTDPEEKYRAQIAMVDRLVPNRTAGLRKITAQELKATGFIAMEIEAATAKQRAAGVSDDDEDYALPIHAEVIPLTVTVGAPEPCERLPANVARPSELAPYREGARLDTILADAYAKTFE